PAGIGDDGPVLRVRAVTKRGVEDPDRLEAGPVVVVERAAERLTWNAERTGMVAVDVRVADLPDERHRRVPDAAPVERVSDLVRVELRRERPVGFTDQRQDARRL